MQILMKIPDDSDGNDIEHLAFRCFKAFETAYLENAQYSDAFLYQPDPTHMVADISFRSGADDPDHIRNLASGWNGHIQACFGAVLKQLYDHAEKDPDGKVRWLSAPDPDIYSMKKAAIALDGAVFDHADDALLVNQAGYPTSILSDGELADILENPSSYAAFTVYPK